MQEACRGLHSKPNCPSQTVQCVSLTCVVSPTCAGARGTSSESSRAVPGGFGCSRERSVIGRLHGTTVAVSGIIEIEKRRQSVLGSYVKHRIFIGRFDVSRHRCCSACRRVGEACCMVPEAGAVCRALLRQGLTGNRRAAKPSAMMQPSQARAGSPATSHYVIQRRNTHT